MPNQVPSKAQMGLGAVVSIGGLTGATGTETWTVLGEPVNADRSGNKRSTIDTSSLSSGQYKTFLGGQIDSGTLSLEFNRVSNDAGQTALLAAQVAPGGVAYDFKVQFPLNSAAGQTTTGDLASFSAIVTECDGWSLAPEKAVTYKATLQISGPVTYTLGS